MWFKEGVHKSLSREIRPYERSRTLSNGYKKVTTKRNRPLKYDKDAPFVASFFRHLTELVAPIGPRPSHLSSSHRNDPL